MKKANEFLRLLEVLIASAETILKTCMEMKELFSEPESIETKATEIPPPKEYSKEEVRELLSEKMQAKNGIYKEAVIAIVKRVSPTGHLSGIPKESYPEVVKEVEELKDA